jgi:hypothetical protein|tara:strand:- start:448 stop:678 length:231 start_codon:yes stop_codon:yes gene_type:complete
MANRITPTQLEKLADLVSAETGLDISICNAPHYGGWGVYINGGSTKVMQRSTPAACKSFLEGISFGIYAQIKKAAA